MSDGSPSSGFAAAHDLTVLNFVSDAVVAVDCQNRITYLNQAAMGLYGVSPEDKLETLADLYDLVWLNPEDDLRSREQLQTKGLWQGKAIHIRRDRQQYYVELTLHQLRKAGQPIGQLIIARNTAHKQPKCSLQTSSVELDDVLNHTNAAIIQCRVFANQGFEYEYCSAGCEPIFGYSPQELIADQSLWFSRVPPEDQAIVLSAFSGVFAEQTTQNAYHFRHKNGSLRWITTTYTSRRSEALDCWIVTGVSTDITHRQHQVDQKRLLSEITNRIRQSLSLEEILATTVSEVRQFLQTHRVLIYAFEPDSSSKVVAESVEAEYGSVIGTVLHDSWLLQKFKSYHQRGLVQVYPDITQANFATHHLEFLSQLQVRAKLVVPILQQHQLWGLLVAHHCSTPRVWETFEVDLLQQLAEQLEIAIQQSVLYERTRQQAQKEHTLNEVLKVVRSSLSLPTLFSSVVAKIGRLLRVDRVSIRQYIPQHQSWVEVAEYQSRPDPSVTLESKNSEIDPWPFKQLSQGEVVQLYTLQGAGSGRDLLHQRVPSDWLLVPLRAGEFVWGCLGLSRDRPPTAWQELEIELALAVADQLAIAIQQAELHQQIQQLNTTLEAQVRERTYQLRQSLEFEALLKRITDKVRDSLDQAQILQTAVQELAAGLNTLSCDTGLYDLEQGTSMVFCESIRQDVPEAQGKWAKMADYSDLYNQLLTGQHLQFCWLPTLPSLIRQVEKQFTVLAHPLSDDRQVIGDLWLYRPQGTVFEEAEVRLVQQVANQCAIALRQARLYETAQRQVAELERLNRLKDDFLSTVSHELRTPMANIKMATQLLAIGLNQLGILQSDSNGIDRYFQILQDECQREIRLINDLLDLARLDADVDPLIVATLALQDWIPHLLEAFAQRAQGQGQSFQVDIPASLPPLTTDFSYLERILSELLNNACKYTPPGESITIAARAIPDGLQISVINSGIEIPACERDRIFEKFYRIPDSDPWQHEGTGLGLALVQKLVNRLKASIRVESENHKTSFTVEFGPDSAIENEWIVDCT